METERRTRLQDMPQGSQASIRKTVPQQVSVVIPWREGCYHRTAALNWVVEKYKAAHPNWIVRLGEHPHGPWSKATAVAAAIDPTSEVLIIADADVWCDNLVQAVGSLSAGHRWAVPHGLVLRLSEESTSTLYRTGTPGATFDEPPYPGYEGGGITVICSADYQTVPMDPRFLGWGQEDMSWAYALRLLLGRPWRGEADLLHMFHPPQDRENRVFGSHDNKRLWRRYHAARRNPTQMRALLAEIKE